MIIEQVAARGGILPMVVEKDFRVCWILGRIYTAPVMASSVVFKGGTSPSKVFGVIERFSEDADFFATRHPLDSRMQTSTTRPPKPSGESE